MKEIISTIEELVAAVAANNIAGNMEIVLQPNTTFVFTAKPIVIEKPITIDGNHSIFVGDGGDCFVVQASNVSIKNVVFEKYNKSISVNGAGKCIENIVVSHCEFSNNFGTAIDVASTVSNSKISKVKIEDNLFLGDTDNGTEESHGRKMFVSLGAGKAIDENAVVNTELSEVLVQNNTTKFAHRMTISISGAMPAEISNNMPSGAVENALVRDIKVRDNVLYGGWDSSISIMAGLLKQKNSVVENVEIANNDIRFGIWAVYMTSVVPIIGLGDTGRLSHIRILNNELQGDAAICGEVQYAIACIGSRTAFFADTQSENIGVNDVKIKGNTISKADYGIFLAGSDLLLDTKKSSICNCFVKDVEIEENKLYDVVNVFAFCGAFAEGRMFDWNIGVPPHNQKWGDLLEAQTKTYVCKGNRVENVTCINNYACGNRYKYRMYGVLAHGHGQVQENQIINVNISGNVFEETEGHIHVSDTFIDGWCEDMGGNSVERDLKINM